MIYINKHIYILKAQNSDYNYILWYRIKTLYKLIDRTILNFV